MRICVYGASSNDISPVFINAGEKLGLEMAKRGIGLTFGGGANGMMGAVARGVESAGSNPAGATGSFVGVGMGMNAGGNVIGTASAVNQAQPQAPNNSWTCSCSTFVQGGNFCPNCGAKMEVTT